MYKSKCFRRAVACVAAIMFALSAASVPAGAEVAEADLSMPNDGFHGYEPVAFPPGPEGVHGEITRLYVALLDRQPESEGLDFWVERRKAGMALTEMIAFFRTSPEFQQTFGSMVNASTAEWVDFMYVEVLERPSEPAGKAFWVELVDSGEATKEDLIIFFADSKEFRVKTGTGLEGFLAQVDRSEAIYGSSSSYRYTRSVPSPFFSEETTVTVVDGIVVERSYEAQFDDPSLDEAWVETGNEIGMHDEGYNPLTMPELHDLCRELLIGFHPTEVQLSLFLDDAGLITSCGGFDPFLMDGPPGESISITNYEVLEPPTA